MIAGAVVTSSEVVAQDKTMAQSTRTIPLPVEGEIPSFGGAKSGRADSLEADITVVRQSATLDGPLAAIDSDTRDRY